MDTLERTADSETALEWVLDQYKEDVIELLGRVCAVSVRTMEIVDGMEDAGRVRVGSSVEVG